MLMRTDPFRDFDRLAQQVLGTTARPAVMPMELADDIPRPSSAGLLLGSQSGVFGLEVAVVGFEFGVAVFQVQDLRDPGDVDAQGDELADALQAIQIVVAVSAGAAVGAPRGEQSAPLVEPQGLRINPAQLRGHRDAVQAARRPRQGIVRH